MKTFEDFRALLTAIKAGEVDPTKVEVMIDNDSCPTDIDCEPYVDEYGDESSTRRILRGRDAHPADVLEALLEHVGIRWRNA